jgi:hypothetical protein
MPVQPDLARISLGEFRKRISPEMIPLSTQFAYFAAASPLTEEDLRDYLEDPVAALPSTVSALLPTIHVLLVPFLERAESKTVAATEHVLTFDRPDDGRYLRSTSWWEREELVAAFAVDELEVGDYHYEFYHHLAKAAAERIPSDRLTDYAAQLKEELASRTHGEVDEESWQAKQALIERHRAATRESRLFKDYLRLSFADTLTLFLHGLCCDIDVEPGPRQLPSRFLRKRLKLLQTMFPPPAGYALFPDELDKLPAERERPSSPHSEAERSTSSL